MLLTLTPMLRPQFPVMWTARRFTFILVGLNSFKYTVEVAADATAGPHSFSGVLTTLAGDSEIGGASSITVRTVRPPSVGAPSAAVSTVAPRFFEGESAKREAPENSGEGTPVGDPVKAEDAGGRTITYAVSGDADFTVNASTGQILVGADVALDFESPRRSYTFGVTATSSAGMRSINVTVVVTNVDEPGQRHGVPCGRPSHWRNPNSSAGRPGRDQQRKLAVAEVPRRSFVVQHQRRHVGQLHDNGRRRRKTPARHGDLQRLVCDGDQRERSGHGRRTCAADAYTSAHGYTSAHAYASADGYTAAAHGDAYASADGYTAAACNGDASADGNGSAASNGDDASARAYGNECAARAYGNDCAAASHGDSDSGAHGNVCAAAASYGDDASHDGAYARTSRRKRARGSRYGPSC